MTDHDAEARIRAAFVHELDAQLESDPDFQSELFRLHCKEARRGIARAVVDTRLAGSALVRRGLIAVANRFAPTGWF